MIVANKKLRHSIPFLLTYYKDIVAWKNMHIYISLAKKKKKIVQFFYLDVSYKLK